VHAVLRRHGMHRLAWLDRPTGQLVRRYERARPGELVHVDVKKLGAIRDGGGWRAHGRGSVQNNFSRAETEAGRRVGYDYVHCAIAAATESRRHLRSRCQATRPGTGTRGGSLAREGTPE
jgi:hypothetical protein